MHTATLIKNFYSSFAAGDAETMVSYYDPDVVFSDPAFGELKGEKAKNMWRMLIDRSKGKLKITLDNVKADEQKGTANWTAEYYFGPDKRKVINNIAAEFEFHNGKIIRHKDHFDLWKWSRLALGWKGLLLGWSMMMKNSIQKQSSELLKDFTHKRNL